MDNKQLTKLVSYFCMGDGGVYPSGSNCRFVMNMKAENRDYVEWVGSVLENITSVKIRPVTDTNTDGYIRKPLLNLSTKSHPFFTTLRNRIYIDSYKGLDQHTLKLLDWESLSILYMSDGCLHIEKPNPKKGLINDSYNVTLNMKRLSYGDHFILKKTLKERLDLEFNINKHYQYYYLRLRCKDVNKFMNGIQDYILPSFSRKIIRTESPGIILPGDDIVCAQQ